MRPRRLVGLLVLLLVAAGGVVGVRAYLDEDDGSSCATPVASPSSPLQDPAKMRARPNEERDRLAAAVGSMAPPFGPVAAGVDYYYDQWLHLYGVRSGILAWTKGNAPVTYLDDATLQARWSLRPATKRTAWDASDRSFLLLDLADNGPVRLGQFDLRSGDQRWCVELAGRQHEGQPVATTSLANDDVVTGLPSGTNIRVTRLAGKDGHELWSRTVDTAARADFLSPITADLLLVGGVEEYRLAPSPADLPARTTLTAVRAATGATSWTWTGAAGSVTHVVGSTGGQTVVAERTAARTTLVALSSSGQQLWRAPVKDGGYEATLRGDVVVTRSRVGLDGYDARAGKPLWHRAIPIDRTYFPYGFALDQMPSLDAGHVLLPTTTSLEALDLGNGSQVSYPLPTDGVSTTYWPYQLLATQHHLGVVANTGAILSDRE